MFENFINNVVKNTQVPLVVAFTPSYFIPVCTCLFSVFANTKYKQTLHVICLLTEDLPEDMRKALIALGEGEVEFSFINLAGQLPADIYIDEKYTIAASYRLLIPDLLPTLDKILYIDCDMIFRNDLVELYRSTDLTNNYMAGVFEATLDFQEKNMRAIGCEPGEYINSGLLLMNLKMLREDNMVEKFMSAAKTPGLEFPDQDVINQLCKGKILGLPPYWNSIRTFLLPQYKSAFLKYYRQEDWADVQRKGNVHYTGPKPWNTFTVAFDIWWYWFEKLPSPVKVTASYPKKLHVLSKVYGTLLGKKLVDAVRGIVRNVKSSTA